ncbi:MAG: T9SS type A sorting domain-containing protein [Bacteroidota bacterium]|nr:T9SS type A sorting domain-containing protein [Bacteroidota bacterium]
MKFYLLLTFLLAAPSLLAQETEHTEVWTGPWNSHEFSPDAIHFENPGLPPQSVTGFPNIQVTKSPNAQTECAVAINPLDLANIIIAEIDYDFFASNGVYTSTDAGQTWVRASIQQNSGNSSYGDPWLTFDGNGNAYLCGLLGVGSGNLSLQIHKSTDKGKTWKPDGIIFQTDPSYPDEPVLSSDLVAGSPYYNTLYAAVVGQQTGSFFPGGIKLHYRRAGSQTFSAEKNVSAFQLVQIPHIAVGLNGKVYVSYLGIDDIVNIKGGLYFNKSTDGGDSWSGDKLIAAASYTDTVNGFPRVGFPLASRIGPTPRIVIDTSSSPRRGWMYVCYARPSSADGKSDLDIFLQRSTDDGESWSAPIRVNDDPAGNGKDQLSPALVVNPDGVIAIAYYDRRDDPNNLFVNTYCAISYDGGFTFENHRISDQATNPFIAREQISLSIADYIAITATRSAVYPVWNDGRTNDGDLDTYTAVIPLNKSGVAGVKQDGGKYALKISPNPVKEKTTISYSSAEGAEVDLAIFDALGRKIRTLFSGKSAQGENYFSFSPENLSTGLYYVTLRSGSGVMTKVLSYIK